MLCSRCGVELPWDGAFCKACGAPRPALEPAFARAEASYARLRQQYDAGSLTAEQFQAAVEGEMIDHGGRYWMLGVQSGSWHAHDGTGWVAAAPPTVVDVAARVAPSTPAGAPAATHPVPAPVPRPGAGAAPYLALLGFMICLAGLMLPVNSAQRYDTSTGDFAPARYSFTLWSEFQSLPLEDLANLEGPVDAAFVLLMALAGTALALTWALGGPRLARTTALLGLALAAVAPFLLVVITGGDGMESFIVSENPVVVESYGLLRAELGIPLLGVGGLLAAVSAFAGRKRASS